MELIELVEQENSYFKKAYLEFDDYIENTSYLIQLITKLDFCKTMDAIPFSFLKNGITSSLNLSLISLMRRHTIQSKLMLRYAIESASLAFYSLYHCDWKEYLLINEKGVGTPASESFRKKANKFLTEKFPECSQRLKRLKEELNDFYAHGSIVSSALVFNPENSLPRDEQFDDFDIIDPRYSIWEIGDIAAMIFYLFSKCLSESDIIIVQDEASRIYAKLFEESMRLKSLLSSSK